MNDFLKKFYWLLFTAICTLFVLSINTCTRKTLTSSPLTILQSDYKNRSESINTIQKTFEKMRTRIDEIHKDLLDPSNIGKEQLGLYITEALNYDEVLKFGLSTVKDTLRDFEGNNSKIVLDYYQRLEAYVILLDSEIEYWDIVLQGIENHMKNGGSQKDISHFINLSLQYNTIKSQRASYQVEQFYTGKISLGWAIFFDICLTLFLISVSIFLGSIILFYLVPIGMDIWNEQREEEKGSEENIVK